MSPRKTTLILAVIFLALIVTEFSLRFSGATIKKSLSQSYRITKDDGRRFRILTLGESTTAEYFSGLNSWPRQLEKRLNQAGISARIYNEGHVGTNSTVILKNLDDYLNTYDPHLVISMMGINDVPAPPPSVIPLVQWTKKLYALHTMRLFQWLYFRASSALDCKIDSDTILAHEYVAAVDRLFNSARTQSVSAIEGELSYLVPGRTQRALALTRISQKFRPEWGQTAASELRSLEFSERAWALSPGNLWVALQYIQILEKTKPKAPPTKLAFDALMKCKYNIPDPLLVGLASLARAMGSSEHRDFFASKGHSIDSGFIHPLPGNYHSLHAAVRQQGRILIAMQYPTLPVQDLESLFRNVSVNNSQGTRDLYFISLEKTFRNSMESRGYDYLFEDRFRGSWGHLTAAGNELIANSLVPTILSISPKEFRN